MCGGYGWIKLWDVAGQRKVVVDSQKAVTSNSVGLLLELGAGRIEVCKLD